MLTSRLAVSVLTLMELLTQQNCYGQGLLYINLDSQSMLILDTILHRQLSRLTPTEK